MHAREASVLTEATQRPFRIAVISHEHGSNLFLCPYPGFCHLVSAPRFEIFFPGRRGKGRLVFKSSLVVLNEGLPDACVRDILTRVSGSCPSGATTLSHLHRQSNVAP